MKGMVVLALLLVASPALADEAAVRGAIDASAPAGFGVVDAKVPSKLARARGDADVRWTRAPRAGWLSVEVRVGRAKAWVRVELGALRPVLRTTRALAAGDVVAARDLILGEAPVDGLDVDPIALTGARVRAALAAGDVVTAGAIDLPPPVRRGAAVAVVIHRGELEITAAGKLEASAHVGEEVSVRVTATRAIVRGRLIAADTVEIPAPGAQP